MAEFEQVARVDEIADGGRKSLIVDDVPVLLLRVGDDFYCIEDVCTHDGQPLSDGPLVGCEITCSRHGARFDVRDGKPMCMPATEPVATFPVEVRDGAVYVGTSE
jgi:3-phenylpropionate/trans-cinnamate dioxygenase ferredoxin subunit